MPYYPVQNYLLGLATIRRERRLPPSAIGEVAVRENQRVEAHDVVLRGSVPGHYVLLNALAPLGLRRTELVTDEMMQVHVGDFVDKGRVLAQNGPGRSAKTVKSPINGVVARVDEGQIILQVTPDPVEVFAMCPGEVTSIRGTTEVLIESVGALIQCAWGNGQHVFSNYRLEPEDGLESLRGESLLNEFRNSAVITNKPITSPGAFLIAATQEMTGIVAPSMHVDLREVALRQKIPVILTEGFGEQQMSEMVYNLLRDNLGRPALLDATEPQRWSANRPEIIIPLPPGGTLPPPPEVDQPLVEGALVRLLRAPYAGMSGRVRRLVEAPRAAENGLRLPGAEVQLSSGQTVFVPLANIAMLGRMVDAPGTGGAQN